MNPLAELLERGGPVVWPLLALSVLSLTLVIERALFYSWCGRGRWTKHAGEAAERLRAGDPAAARERVEGDAGVLAPVVRAAGGGGGGGAAAAEARTQAARIERLLPWLGVVVSAAPMLGILGTVLGIIASFDALGSPTGGAGAAADPRAVGGGIAEALLSTAAGLTVTLATLPAWVWLRGRADRLIDRLEDLVAAAEQR